MEDKRLERIEAKIDDISDHLLKIDVTLAAQHESLKNHIKRTTILEKEVAPIKKYINRAQGALMLITFLSAIAGAIKIFYKI
jgi:hypothetical protein